MRVFGPGVVHAILLACVRSCPSNDYSIQDGLSIYIYTYMYVYIYIYDVYVYICTYIHIHIHIHIYIYVYIYILGTIFGAFICLFLGEGVNGQLISRHSALEAQKIA